MTDAAQDIICISSGNEMTSHNKKQKYEERI